MLEGKNMTRKSTFLGFWSTFTSQLDVVCDKMKNDKRAQNFSTKHYIEISCQ